MAELEGAAQAQQLVPLAEDQVLVDPPAKQWAGMGEGSQVLGRSQQWPLGWTHAADPRNRALPKVNTPPSAAANRYPLPSDEAAIPTIARFSRSRAAEP